jgi:NTP pyrophosphatase (non-canonical NTP hydrolase)
MKTLHRLQITAKVVSELHRAYEKHGHEKWGRHEFYAILKEEVDELWDAIKSNLDDKSVQAEAIQVAAMVFRYLETGDRYRK